MIISRIVIIYTDQYSRIKIIQLGNREQIIVIICINSKDKDIPLFLIIQGINHFANQYFETNLLYNQIIKTINNRQINNKIDLE